MNKRIDETNKRIEGMDTRLNGKIEEMDIRLNRRIDSNFKWILGVQITMWITIIVANSFTLNEARYEDMDKWCPLEEQALCGYFPLEFRKPYFKFSHLLHSVCACVYGFYLACDLVQLRHEQPF